MAAHDGTAPGEAGGAGPALHLTQIRMLSDAPATDLVRLLVGEDSRGSADIQHRLVWLAFGDDPDRRRDFLWRSEGRGVIHALSQRPPEQGPGTLFEVRTRPFQPRLEPGQALDFVLRANPAISRTFTKTRRDIFSEARHEPELQDLDAETRDHRAFEAWLGAQGEQHGFALLSVEIDRPRTVRLPRPKRRPATFVVAETRGRIVLRDQARFLTKLAEGFGRGKAFGFGLMMLRAAR